MRYFSICVGVDGLGVDVMNLVDIRSESNRELIMRLKTDIKSGDTFYTDLNGFQVRYIVTYS